MNSRILIVYMGLVAFAGCGGSSTPIAPSAGVPYSSTDLRVGDGPTAITGRLVQVNYTGWLYDGSRAEQKGNQFDTTTGKSPFSFYLGSGQVIKGWDLGIPGMKVGGLRRLVLPPDLAYGQTGSGNSIPGNATLVFEIELLSVQ